MYNHREEMAMSDFDASIVGDILSILGQATELKHYFQTPKAIQLLTCMLGFNRKTKEKIFMGFSELIKTKSLTDAGLPASTISELIAIVLSFAKESPKCFDMALCMMSNFTYSQSFVDEMVAQRADCVVVQLLDRPRVPRLVHLAFLVLRNMSAAVDLSRQILEHGQDAIINYLQCDASEHVFALLQNISNADNVDYFELIHSILKCQQIMKRNASVIQICTVLLTPRGERLLTNGSSDLRKLLHSIFSSISELLEQKLNKPKVVSVLLKVLCLLAEFSQGPAVLRRTILALEKHQQHAATQEYGLGLFWNLLEHKIYSIEEMKSLHVDQLTIHILSRNEDNLGIQESGIATLKYFVQVPGSCSRAILQAAKIAMSKAKDSFDVIEHVLTILMQCYQNEEPTLDSVDYVVKLALRLLPMFNAGLTNVQDENIDRMFDLLDTVCERLNHSQVGKLISQPFLLNKLIVRQIQLLTRWVSSNSSERGPKCMTLMHNIVKTMQDHIANEAISYAACHLVKHLDFQTSDDVPDLKWDLFSRCFRVVIFHQKKLGLKGMAISACRHIKYGNVSYPEV